MTPDRAYLSVESWPEEFDEARRRDAIASLLGVEAFRAKELARRAVPAMLARVSVEQGDQVARQLRQWGVAAEAIRADSLAALLAPPFARTMSPADEAFNFTLVRATGKPTGGESLRIDPARIVAIVRAHARMKKGHADADFGVHALHQLHGTLGAEAWDQGSNARAALRVAEILDVHTLDAAHVRVVGDRFACDVLAGIQPPPSNPREEMDALATLLCGRARGVRVDANFEHARFLAEFARDLGVVGDWKSAAGFGVYSAWRACMAVAIRQNAETTNR